MQLRLDNYQPPLGTPHATDKFFHCDFSREKKYFSVTVLSLSADTTVELFNEMTDVSSQPYSSEIVTDGQSYASLLQSICNDAYLIDFIKIQFGDTTQINETISVVWRDANGRTCSYPVIPQNSLDVYQFQNKLVHIDLRKEPIILDGNTFLSFFVQARKPIISAKFMFLFRERIVDRNYLSIYNKLTQIKIDK